MPKAKSALELWKKSALALESEERPTRVPIHVLFGEAVDLARFFDKYWATQTDKKGKILRRGLDSAVKKSCVLGPDTGKELISLQEAGQQAHTAYLLTVDPKASVDVPTRARYVLGELIAVLEWYFDDGVEDENDTRLSKLSTAYAGDPDSMDGIAAALDNHAALAKQHRAELDGLGGFDAKLIDEAGTLATALRDRPVAPLALSPAAREALSLRNKVLTLLWQRMSAVRAAARFVFRDRPEIAREATSAYERRKRNAAQRAAQKKAVAA